MYIVEVYCISLYQGQCMCRVCYGGTSELRLAITLLYMCKLVLIVRWSYFSDCRYLTIKIAVLELF